MEKANFYNSFSIDIIPENDAERINALRQYDLLDLPPDAYFQAIVHQAAELFDVPIALVSLIDGDEVFFKGNVGMEGVEKVNRGTCLCSLAILSSEPTIITNPLQDSCLANNPFVQNECGIRFYAGAPLITLDGYRIGTVTLADRKERSFSEKQANQLVRFANMVMHDVELRLSIRKKEKELEKEIKQRQKIVTSAIIEAQERERSHLGLELHDNVGQILTTVKLYNEMALEPTADAAAILGVSTKFLQGCIDEVRMISRQLSTTTLGDIDLSDSVKELIESVNFSGKISIELSNQLNHHTPISQELHITIYRIIQEGLNNIIKHANAVNVTVTLVDNSDGILLAIVDDGIGFDKAEKKIGMGISNMRTRAENLSGNIKVESTKGNGCQLNVFLPYNSEN